MVSLSWRQERIGDATLVALTVSTDGPRRVRIENRLDGPLWPPRRNGQPAAGWDDDGYEGVVGPGRPALGYAAAGEPAEPPAEVVSTDPVPDDAGDDPATCVEATPAGVVRALGDPLVPRDAVPRSTRPAGADTPTPNGPAGETDGAPSDASLTPAGRAGDETRSSGPGWANDHRDRQPSGGAGIPPAIESWFDDVERALDRSGEGAERPITDRATLRRIARRAERLARRFPGAPASDNGAAAAGDRER